MRNINRIIIHHTATPAHMNIGVREIRHWHVEDNGWSDIGYHFVIRRDGVAEAGRPIKIPGAHAKGHNADSIGIALVGTGPDVTRHQWRSLNEKVILLMAQYGNPDVIGHRDIANTQCPGFNVKTWWNRMED